MKSKFYDYIRLCNYTGIDMLESWNDVVGAEQFNSDGGSTNSNIV